MFKKLILVAFLSGMNFTYAPEASTTTTPTDMHPALAHIHKEILDSKESVESQLAERKQFFNSLKLLASEDLRKHVGLQSAQNLLEEIKNHSIVNEQNLKISIQRQNIENFLDAIAKLTPNNKPVLVPVEHNGTTKMAKISIDSTYTILLLVD